MGETEDKDQFPWKLYNLLHTAKQQNEKHIISWTRDGTAFKLHNCKLFIEECMKKMSNQTKFNQVISKATKSLGI